MNSREGVRCSFALHRKSSHWLASARISARQIFAVLGLLGKGRARQRGDPVTQCHDPGMIGMLLERWLLPNTSSRVRTLSASRYEPQMLDQRQELLWAHKLAAKTTELSFPQSVVGVFEAGIHTHSQQRTHCSPARFGHRKGSYPEATCTLMICKWLNFLTSNLLQLDLFVVLLGSSAWFSGGYHDHGSVSIEPPAINQSVNDLEIPHSRSDNLFPLLSYSACC